MKCLTKIALCLCLVLFTACEKNNGLSGNQEKPQWTAITPDDVTSSMTAVVQVDLTKHYPLAKDVQLSNDDLLAAFVGNSCCGVVAPKDGLFFLYIVEPKGENRQFRLRYYSAQLKNTFVSDEEYSFQKDGRLGDVNNPFEPTFIVEK